MTKRECTRNAIRHKQTAYVPHNIDLVDEYKLKVKQQLGIAPQDLDDYMGNHIQKCDLFSGSYVDDEIYRDEYGVIWDRSGLDKDIGIIRNQILPDCSLENFSIPAFDEEKINQKCISFLNDGKDRFKFAKMSTALFERAWSLRGFENFLMDLMEEEDFVQELLEQITERNVQILEIALKHDFDGIYFGDDYGQQTGMLMSPNTWRRLVKPQLKKLFAVAKKYNKVVALHSCGNIYPILGDLIDIGLDVYQTVQPEIYDLANLKREFGQDLTFYGTISVQHDLPFCTPAQLKDIIRRTRDIMGQGGGFIVAPTHRVSVDTPIENFAAMVEVFNER